MKLYIVGNGFDCHHNLKTSYNHYREFLSNTYPQMVIDYEKFPYLDILDSPWSDIERALAIDYRSLMENCIKEGYPDGTETHLGTWLNMDIELEKATYFVKDFTGRCFVQWLNQINYQVKKDLNLSAEDYFICFNYTDTLSKIYAIDQSNILYIHGRLQNIEKIKDNISIRKEIQFGAVGLSASKIETELYDKYEKVFLSQLFIFPAIFVLCEFIQKSTKNLDKNVPILSNFLNGKTPNEIVIMGHTLNGSDTLYYDKILIPLFKDKKWTFYRFGGKNGRDANMIKSFIAKNNLLNVEIIDW
jgi:hypothetical protein